MSTQMPPAFLPHLPCPFPSTKRPPYLHQPSIPLCRARVPHDATSAAGDITQAVRAALLAGRRRLCVDVLTASTDVRQRTFDRDASATVLLSLVNALQPVLPAEPPEVRIFVPGPAAALRIREFLRETAAKHVSVSVLGVRDDSGADGQRLNNVEQSQPQAFVVTDPPAQGNAVTELRVLLRDAHSRGLPVIVHNHPRQDTLYAMLGFEGHIPFELTKFESAFVLAPFALKTVAEDDTRKPDLPIPPARFVMLRKYPGKWALWKFQDENERRSRRESRADVVDPAEMEQLDDYCLCEEFDARPTDGQLMQVIRKVML